MAIRFYQMVYVIFVYLLSSIPFSLLVAKSLSGTDIREYGDKNPGAYNAWRYGSKAAGVFGFSLDFLKGGLAVFAAKKIWPDSELILLLTALSAVSGHAWSFYLHFNGGKALAVTAGVFLFLFKGFVALVWLLLFGFLRVLGVPTPKSVVITLFTANIQTFVSYRSWYLRSAVFLVSLIVTYKHKKALFSNQKEAYLDT